MIALINNGGIVDKYQNNMRACGWDRRNRIKKISWGDVLKLKAQARAIDATYLFLGNLFPFGLGIKAGLKREKERE